MSRMSPYQNFVGFANPDGTVPNIKVEIQGELFLTTPEGDEFPPLTVRMVPGQHDDLLVAAPDLDKWGWDCETDPRRFIFKRLGLSTARSVVAPEAATYSHSSDEEDDDMPELISANRVRQESILAEETVIVPPRSVTTAQIKPLAEIQDEPCAGECAADPCLWSEPTCR